LSVTNASVLLTTSHKTKYKLEQWRDILNARGINPLAIEKLSSDSLQSGRSEEIIQWYTTKHNPGEEFVIIDDDKTLNGLPEKLKGNLVLTSPSVGLTDELADTAISILKQRNVHSSV